jgi:O-acetyl-ADP-ribose deacetylase (regulator of RNase III)
VGIESGRGNLLRAEVEALVNTVNTEGVMGKGIALQFKRAFPENLRAYEQACRQGDVVIGRMHVVERLASPRFIINFPTKKHWRQPSRLEYVQLGLVDLVKQVEDRGIGSIAVPPLGCGLGGLAWEDVRPMIVGAFAALPDVRVVLFEPGAAPSPEAMSDARSKPAMTSARAVVIALIDQYLSTGYEYRMSLVEAQKLAYFAQVVGEPLKLSFKAHYYGPYSDGLRKLLRNTEGHYTRGVGDGENKPETPIELLPGAADTARLFIDAQPEVRVRLDRVAQLIEGFETPLGMELLATVHWVMQQNPGVDDVEQIVTLVHNWSSRKRSTMKPGQIRAAWIHLREQGW